MGFNVIDSTATNVKVTATAGSALVSGDLVSNHETGVVNKVSETLSINIENNATAGLSVIRANTSLESNAAYGASAFQATANTLVELGNGNIALIYSGNGSLDYAGINIRIRNVLGADVIAKIVVSTDNTIYSYRIVKLNTSKFAVCWIGTGLPLRFQIFNNDGTTVGSIVDVESLVGNYSYHWNVSVLTNGNLVFVYDKVTSKMPSLQFTIRRGRWSVQK